ncbi:hypothetical protein BS049_RS23280 [Vibrio parahaemolyticus]|nr:hypothetical protein [Vibrio parahaemolyticus]
MKFNLKMLAAATAAIASSSVFAADITAPSAAGAELHWDGKVPMEVTGESVILTGLGGVPLTTELKGGSLYIEKDGSFTSSGIPLELHYRMCSDGTTSDGSCDAAGAVGDFVAGEGADAVGDIVSDASWTLMASRYTVGGRETSELDEATININGATLAVGDVGVSAERPVFTTEYTPSPLGGSATPGAQYAAYASILASKAI